MRREREGDRDVKTERDVGRSQWTHAPQGVEGNKSSKSMSKTAALFSLHPYLVSLVLFSQSFIGTKLRLFFNVNHVVLRRLILRFPFLYQTLLRLKRKTALDITTIAINPSVVSKTTNK